MSERVDYFMVDVKWTKGCVMKVYKSNKSLKKKKASRG